jgi:hypothetical protein
MCKILGVINVFGFLWFKLGVANSNTNPHVMIWGLLGVANSKTNPRVTIWGLLASFLFFFFAHKVVVADTQIDPRVIK